MAEISIIIPTYNPDIGLLKRSVNSILEQSYGDFELLIVDDGSCEEAQQQIILIAKLDQRIRIIRQHNKGVSAARNTGIRNANGEYFAFVDDDDVVSPFFLEESHNIILRENCDIVLGGVIHQKRDLFPPEALEPSTPDYTVLKGEECRNYIYEMLAKARRLPCGGYISRGPVAKLVKRSAQNTLFPEDLSFGEDNYWNVSLLLSAERIAVVDRVWYLYVVNANSATNRFEPHAIEQAELLIHRVSELLLFDEEHLEYYGDYLYCQAADMVRRWLSHKECNLREWEKIKLLRVMGRKQPWETINSRKYWNTKTKNIKGKIRIILFREGLLALYWKLRKL